MTKALLKKLLLLNSTYKIPTSTIKVKQRETTTKIITF